MSKTYEDAIEDVRTTIQSALKNPVIQTMPVQLVLQALLASIVLMDEAEGTEGVSND